MFSPQSGDRAKELTIMVFLCVFILIYIPHKTLLYPVAVQAPLTKRFRFTPLKCRFTPYFCRFTSILHHIYYIVCIFACQLIKVLTLKINVL